VSFAADRRPKALIVDWGGVLTTPVESTMSAWADADDVDLDDFGQVMREWFGEPGEELARRNPVIAIERGEIELPHFEAELAARLRTRDGHRIPAKGLLKRMFDGFQHAPDMRKVVRGARKADIKTALLSNSWGTSDYPRDGWDDLFDAVVISGEVGMRKPEPEIFHYTLDLLGVEPAEAVFVDDLPFNIQGAVDVGIVGVLHASYEETVAELEALFGIPLR
jgi:epoxide hydrolase-like predicted phosphatase